MSEFSDSLASHDLSHDPVPVSHDLEMAAGKNPDEIELEEDSEEEVGGACKMGSEVTERTTPIIKRRNLAIYQSHDSD